MTLTLTIQDQPNSAARPDLTQRLTRCVFSTNRHGDESLQVSAPLSLARSFERYDAAGIPHAIISDGALTAFQGRVEDTSIRGDGLDLTALGYQRALSDIHYTALWSSTQVGAWIPAEQNANTTNLNPARMQMDTNNRLYIAPQKGASYDANAGQVAGAALTYAIPSGSARQIVGVSFDFETNGVANWLAGMQTRNDDYSGAANQWLYTASTGLTPGSVFRTFTGAPRLLFFFVFATAAPTVFAAETGTQYVKLTNVRVVTTTTNAVQTTITVAQGAGNNVTCTVGSTANMYVGQRLHIGIPAALGETVVVEQILSSTQFVADFTAAAAIGVNVQAHVVYADEIVKNLVSTVSTLNSTQLQSSTTQVQSPALDLMDELYEDRVPNTLLDYLIGLGDNQAVPRLWEWGVTGDRALYFRPEGDDGLTWYVDVTAIDVQRTIEHLINSAYAVYQDANGRTLRGATRSDAESVARYTLTRQRSVDTDTTSLTQANVRRDTTLSDKADPTPRFGLTFGAIYNAGGGRVPIWMPRAGDTIVIRNLPPTLSTSIDHLRTFRIARTSCDLVARTLTVEPFVPLPSVQALLARGLRGQTT